MSKTRNHGHLAAAPQLSFLGIWRRFSPLILVSLLLCFGVANAETPEEQYLTIFSQIQEADALNTSGKAKPALAKYKEIQTSLQLLQRNHPDWNKGMLAFRLKYVGEQISAISEKLAPRPEAQTPQHKEAAASDSKAGSADSSIQVKLLEAGAEPRKQFRLHPKPGDKQTLNMSIKLGMDMKMGDSESPAIKMPAMRMVMVSTVKSVSPDGDINYEMLMEDASVVEEQGVMPQVVEAMKASMTGLKGLSASGTTSSRGFNKGSDIKVPAGADPQVRQAIEQMRDSLSKFTAPFPEEALGPGAKWEVRMPIKSQGMVIDQTTTYELVSIEGERLKMKTTVVQRAANQKFQNPSMPGLPMDLTKMTGRGNGNLTLDLGQLLPPEAGVESKTEFSMAMDVGGQKQSMTMKMDMNLQFEAK
jgi:hypothetical protein